MHNLGWCPIRPRENRTTMSLSQSVAIVSPQAPWRDQLLRLLAVPVAIGTLLAWNGAGSIPSNMSLGQTLLYWNSATLLVWLLAHLSSCLCGWLLKGRHIPLFFILLIGVIVSSPLCNLALFILTELNSTDSPFAFGHAVERFYRDTPVQALQRGVGAFLLWPTINVLWFKLRGTSSPYEFSTFHADPPFGLPARPFADASDGPIATHSQPLAERLIANPEAVVALEADDHYIRVHRAIGSSPLLTGKFGLCAKLLEQTGLGHQVHRSWWVNFSCIRAVRRRGRRVELVLTNGLTIPVSESHKSLVHRYWTSRWESSVLCPTQPLASSPMDEF